MHQASTRITTEPDAQRTAAPALRQPAGLFAGLIDAVLVDDPAPFIFSGSVARSHATSVWTWVVRDLCADFISAEAVASGGFGASELAALMPDVLERMKAGMGEAEAGFEASRRLRARLGSDAAPQAIPVLIGALRNRALLAKAQSFGRACNATADDATLANAIQSMPLHDSALAALLFHAAIGEVTNPTKFVGAAIKIAGAATEAAVARTGLGPVVDAVLAHAQNQLHALRPVGAFADIDLTCRGLERFHRLIRSLTGYIEFSRGSRWSGILSALTKQASERIEPRLREVVLDVNQALRKGRDGADRLDEDRLLAAINGVYLLASIRECRDSLALNALFDQAWSQSGQVLEMHLQRNLDLLRTNPDDLTARARIDAGIKMAEVRFNPEYAETLRRARAAALRRA